MWDNRRGRPGDAQSPSLPSGSVGEYVSAIYLGLYPVLYFLLNPESFCVAATIAKFDALGKETGILKPLNMLRTVRHQIQDLSLRK